ncbi:MAG: glutamate mutase L [Candidatus Sabulitectum sp.]|nr:glutamate mutase L [Candidatus Sabulitectum sp.]
MIILASDVGSTTTKVVVFSLSGGSLTAIASVQEPTTVEPPFSDVTVGLFRAVSRLADSTGLVLIDGDSLCVPYFTTSSAGGGLQMLVIGYTMADSLRIAESTAYGAGAVISGAFAMNTQGGRLNQIEKISRLNPDLVLMAGGTDGGAVSGPVSMAHLLNLAAPVPKYGTGSLPLLFCGNIEARRYIGEALGSHFSMSTTENVVPGNFVINSRPAISAVQELFMEHVMEKAPGYPKLLDLVSGPVVPTPMGVSRMLKACSKKMGKGAVMVDMGGATTDIFTVSKGKLQRTVAANIGMSFSMTNTLAEVGLPAVIRHIPGVDGETVRGWAMGKSLFPATVSHSETADAIEAAVAVEGLRTAWNHHLDIAYSTGRISWREGLGNKHPSAINTPLETLSGDRFRLDSLGMLIGAGGIFSHSSSVRAAWMLAEAFRPPGLTTLYVDKFFRSPHLGAMLKKYPAETIEYYMKDCIKPVCRVLSPPYRNFGKFAEITGSFGKKTVRSGEYLYLEDTADITFRVFAPGIDGLDDIDDGLPLLIDCRRNSNSLPMDFREDVRFGKESVQLPCRDVAAPCSQNIPFSMSLPFAGKLTAGTGDMVNPDQCLGLITELPPRQFILQISKARSCPADLSAEELIRGITVKAGDPVKKEDLIFTHNAGQYRAEYNSPVNGKVTRIIPPGIVMMEEDMEHDNLPHVVEVCRKMGIPPRKMFSFLRVSTGDFVYNGQMIAADPRVNSCTSPVPGFVTGIDHELGTVTIQYSMTPILLESPLVGRVTGTDSSRTVNMECTGLKLQGVLGFGKTVKGPLRSLSAASRNGDIAFTGSPADSSALENARKLGVSGLICSSVAADTLVAWLGSEPGIFITGQEDTPFSLLILNGIGGMQMNPAVLASLSSSTGTHTALFPETKIRAGIHRPFLVISSD